MYRRTSSFPIDTISTVYDFSAAYFLFADLLKLICNELNLCSDNNLNTVLSRTDHTCNTCRFDLLLIDKSLILYFETKTCDAVVNGSHVGSPSKSLKDDRSYLCVVVIGKAYALLALCIVILASRSL